MILFLLEPVNLTKSTELRVDALQGPKLWLYDEGVMHSMASEATWEQRHLHKHPSIMTRKTPHDTDDDTLNHCP